MGKVQNGCLDIGTCTCIEAAPRKTKQRSANTYRLHSFAILLLNLLQVPLTINQVEKNKHETFNFVHLFSSSFLLPSIFLPSFFFSATHTCTCTCNSKTMRCMRILYLPNRVLLMEIIPTCLELGVSYSWWAMASIQFPRCSRSQLDTCLYTLYSSYSITCHQLMFCTHYM